MRYLYSGDTIKTIANTGNVPKDTKGTVIGTTAVGVIAYFPSIKAKELLCSNEFVQIMN